MLIARRSCHLSTDNQFTVDGFEWEHIHNQQAVFDKNLVDGTAVHKVGKAADREAGYGFYRVGEDNMDWGRAVPGQSSQDDNSGEDTLD